jgi:ATP/maltotriose-dependent transcriptional regulator MalT
MPTNREHDEQDFAQERAVLREWDYLQQSLFTFALTASHSPIYSRRTMIEAHIIQNTEGRARLWWKPYIAGSAAKDSRLFEVRYQQIRYGMLEMSSGYLVSHLLPSIPQNFANLCALLLALAEYEELVQHQLAQLSTPYNIEAMKLLTPRERDVLQGLVRHESEPEMAHRLGIELTTVRTHIQRLYRRLDVHSSQEAVLRSFALKLVDWLDLP